MTAPSKFLTEIEGAKLMIELQQQGVRVHEYHRAHDLPIPMSLARFLGEETEVTKPVTKAKSSKVTISPLHTPEAPAGALPSWIWVPERECAVASLVLAWLNQASEPLTPTQIFGELEKLKPGINKGTIANVGTRLDGKVIGRNGDGWKLLRRDRAPLLHQGHLWGEPDIFEKTEVALYRRNAVKHVLGAWTGGLQIVQIVDALKEGCPWFNSAIPVSKDLLKMDMKELESAQAVKRRGRSGKWELTE